MKQLFITLLLFFSLIQNGNSQNNIIKGDSISLYKSSQETIKKLHLINFDSLQTTFFFRFKNHGQVVEIFQTNNQINGILTNYIYHSFLTTRRIIIQKKQLNPIKAKEAYDIIQKSKVLNLQSDNKIKKWKHGFDGISYFIEHSNNKEHWLKQYWSPSIQDSIPEALVIVDFIKSLSETLKLPEEYKKFQDSLPHKGCYNSGGVIMSCYPNIISFELGYFGSTKLPLGFKSFYYNVNIIKLKLNFKLGFQYQTDYNNNYFLECSFNKDRIFIDNSRNIDIISYYYQKRKLNFISTKNAYHNHIFNYGIRISKFLIYSGVNYMISDEKKFGAQIGLKKLGIISTDASLSIFDNEIDYRILIHKNFYNNFLSKIGIDAVGVVFENFNKYNDVQFYLLMSL